MTFGGQVRLAGAITVILSAMFHTAILTFVGIAIMAIGATWQIDGLERRVAALEPKEKDDDEA